MANKYCTKCGTEMPEEAKFCTNCGQPFDPEAISYQTKREKANNEKRVNRKAIYALLAVLGVLLLIILGSMFYSEYSEAREKRLAREKFVADSLEQVRQDSIRLAEQKEQERIEAEELARFREKMSFENFIGMLNHYDKPSYANKCGLTLIYRNDTEEEYGTSTEIVYGYDVEKDDNYNIIAKSDHACYFEYMLDTSTGAEIAFKDSEDADLLFEKAKDYGLIMYENCFYIPNKRLPNGKSIMLEELDETIYENTCGMISHTIYRDGWYVIYIGLDGI